MQTKTKNRIIFLLLGVITGGLISGAAGLLLYASFKVKKSPKFYQQSDSLIGHISEQVKSEEEVVLKEGYEIFSASSLDRIFENGNTLTKPQFEQEVSVSLARNEYEAFQIVVQNGRDPLKDVRLEISDLAKGSDVLSKENIKWRVVGYVPTKKPYYPVKYVGNWPDPLMPFDKKDVEPGVTQPFWVSIYAPLNTPAGEYKGDINVFLGDEQVKTIPLSVRVYNFNIPKETSFKTAFDFYGHETHVRYPRGDKETEETYRQRIRSINEKFIIEMLKYRMNPVLNVDPTNNHDLASVDRYRVHGLNNFSIGKRGGTLNNNWPKDDEGIEKLLPLYRQYGEILALNRMLDLTYIYTWDEGKIGNPIPAKVASMIRRAHPKLKNMMCYHGFWEPEKHPGWGDNIDIWCFQISKFNRKKMQAMKDRGIEMWMYISGPSGDGTPNLAMDFDSIDYRIVPWMSWKLDIEGFLYWCVNWWPKVDPFKSAANTKWAQNGNGLLFYPGEDGPIASIRAEVYRDGMEDYEYLTFLKKLLWVMDQKGMVEANQKLYDQATSYLTVDDDIVKSTRQFTKDNAQLKDHRDQLANIIEQVVSVIQSHIK